MLPPLADEIDIYEPMPAVGEFSLELQPQRPGDLCDWLEFELEPRTSVRLADVAQIPLGLWLTIAIEAKRILRSLEMTGSTELEARLDRAARLRVDTAVCRAPARGLRAYADALRAGAISNGEQATGLIVLTPPQAMSTAWEQDARRAGLPLGPWLACEAESELADRVAWEAAAAERGQSLAEWILRSAR